MKSATAQATQKTITNVKKFKKRIFGSWGISEEYILPNDVFEALNELAEKQPGEAIKLCFAYGYAKAWNRQNEIHEEALRFNQEWNKAHNYKHY